MKVINGIVFKKEIISIKSKAIGKSGYILIILLICIPLSYVGLIYMSITSASISIANPSVDIGIAEVLDLSGLVDIFLSRKISGEFDLVIEGHGYVSTTVKSFQSKIYLEDIQLGTITSNEFFIIPASGIETAHMDFQLDLSSFSLSDIEYVANSISSHNGEIKMSLEGFIEPVILIFPINVPINVDTYTTTITNAPKVTSLSWDSSSCEVGEDVGFHINVKNVFRASDVNGVVDVLVREDVSYGSDVTAESYQFPVYLRPGESKTFTDEFSTYKESSTRGFFLKTQWGSQVIGEQTSAYPPRLGVIEGRLEFENVYWTVNRKTASSCELGETVQAHISFRAYDASVSGTIRVKIRKDIAGGFDEDFAVSDYDLQISKGETKSITLEFTPNEASSGNSRGYFIEVEGEVSWTMTDAYPPRLKVKAVEIGIPSIVFSWFTINEKTVTEAEQGENVQAHVNIKAINGDITGTLTLRIRKDIYILPDEDYVIKQFSISLSEGQYKEITQSFTASEITSSTFRGYFIQVDFDSWAFSWTMDDAYPPRLKVNVPEQPEEPKIGYPIIQNVWWTRNTQIITQATQGQEITANVRIKAVEGSVSGTVFVHIKKDMILLPDDDHVIETFSINLIEGENFDLKVDFTAAEKSGMTFRGYFMQVDLVTWNDSWTMESAYPPRLKVN